VDTPTIGADLGAEMAAVDALVDWRRPADPAVAAALARDTPAKGWTVADTLAHLAWTDLAGIMALGDPDGFPARARAMSPPAADQLPEVWPAARTQLLDGLDRAQRDRARVPWFTLPMSAVSFATARLMEYWAHGEDIAQTLGVARQPTARLRHVCHIGVATLGFSFAQHGLPTPADPVRVELGAPDGSTWAWGPPDAADRVSGPALEFALVVTQRRVAADAALRTRGPIAAAWLPIAQCFAGAGQIADPDRAGLPISPP
jgi:uncharacterized protein (TIGR03084 family)